MAIIREFGNVAAQERQAGICLYRELVYILLRVHNRNI